MNIEILNITVLRAKIYALVVFIFTTSLAFGQENSISPIFGLSNSNTSFENDLVALNQSLGKEVIIESFSNNNLVGKNFTVSTNISSNVDKLYLLSSGNTLSVYDLPYFFDPDYAGEQSSINLTNTINDFDYHQSKNLIYAFNIANEELYGLDINTGAVISTSSIPFSASASSFTLKTNENFIALCGKDVDSTKILFHNISTGFAESITLNTLYSSFHLISHSSQSVFYAVAQDLNNLNWLISIDPLTLDVQTISALASCSNCTTESYNFSKNALALDWETNHLLAVLEQTINGSDNYSLLTIDLSNGEVLNFVSLDRAVDNLYYNKAASDLVFPGDANHDGVVNTRDLLPIGLRYTYNTTPRFTQSIEWVGQHSFNTGVIAQGADVKHADCNGDGVINDLDIEAIKANFTSVHNSSKSSAASASDCDYPLGFSFIQTAYQDNDVVVNVKLGEVFDPVTDVYGVSFTIAYDNSFVVPNSMHTIGLNSWFGNDGANSIHTSNDDYLNGEFEITLTGVDLLNRSGGGDIIQVAWTMEDNLIPIANPFTDMNLRIENTYIINLAEDELESCGTDTLLQVSRKEEAVNITSINDIEIKIYPNPAQEQIHIVSDEMIQSVELVSVNGSFIQNLEMNKSQSIDVSSISKGVYLLQINTKDGTYFEKVVIE